MPIQTYRCPEHGEFEVRLPFTEPVPPYQACPARAWRAAPEGRRMATCYAISPWQPPTGIAFRITPA